MFCSNSVTLSVFVYTYVCTVIYSLHRTPGLRVCGETFNPVIHLQLLSPSSSRDTDNELLECVAKDCISNGVAVVVAKYLRDELKVPPARCVCI